MDSPAYGSSKEAIMSPASTSYASGFYVKLTDIGQAMPLLQGLATVEDENALLETISRLRLLLICNQQQKLAALHLDIPQSLLDILRKILSSPTSSSAEELTVNIFHALSSLASGGPEVVTSLIDRNILSILFPLLQSDRNQIVQAALRCFGIILHGGAPLERVSDYLAKNPEAVQRLVELMGTSALAAEIACELCTVLGTSSGNDGGGGLLGQLPMGVVMNMMASSSERAKRASLMYVLTCVQHPALFDRFVESCEPIQEEFTRVLTALMSPDEDGEIRLLAINIMNSQNKRGLLLYDNKFIRQKMIPAVARLCRKDQTIPVRVGAAESMAVIIDNDAELQELASYTDQLMVSLLDYLKTPSLEALNMATTKKAGAWSRISDRRNTAVSPREASQELKRAAFLALSALASSSENIRKRVSDMDGLVSCVISSACNTDRDANPALVYAALRLLHSLSRSVQQLRTVFKDHNIWETVLSVMRDNEHSQISAIASAIIANLSVEFSPNQQNLMKNGLWAHLGTMLSSSEEETVLNAIWTLMNMTYMAQSSTKRSVIEIAPVSVIERLLSMQNKQIHMCALGLIRNFFFSTPAKESSPPPGLGALGLSLGSLGSVPDIATRLLRRQRHSFSSASSSSSTSASVTPALTGDFSDQNKDVMEWAYCRELFQVLLRYLSTCQDASLREQCFCAMGNAAGTPRGQDLILHDREAMKLLRDGLQHSYTPVQSSAVFCISNLAKSDEDSPMSLREERACLSTMERQKLLIDLNFQQELRKLLLKDDAQLFERVKTALQYLGGSI